MPAPKNALSKLQEAQAKAQEDKARRIELTRERAAAGAAARLEAPKESVGTPVVPATPSAPTPVVRPWCQVHVGQAGLHYAMRAQPAEAAGIQPWTQSLADDLLRASCDQTTVLCLVWPAQLRGLAPLHAMATFERALAKDLRGMRTLLYPGTHSTAASLQTLLVDRFPFSELYRAMIDVKTGNQRSEVVGATTSASFKGVLGALNDLRNYNSQLPPPSFAELIPVFVSQDGQWSPPTGKPLERSITKVQTRGFRNQVRDAVNADWNNLREAAHALLVMHGSSLKSDWRRAFEAYRAARAPAPELLLLDATSAAQRSNYNAVRRIPEFLDYARAQLGEKLGAVVVTDDPKTFFGLRAQLTHQPLPFDSQVYAAEGTDVYISRTPMPAGWKPEQRSNAQFPVRIVDRDAAAVAVTFLRLAAHTVGEESPAHKAMTSAALYVLRLSNLPAGLVDLMAAGQDGELDAFSVQRSAWSEVEREVRVALESGALNELRVEVGSAMGRARKLVDAWSDGTLMAQKLAAAVERFAESPKGQHLTLVLPSQKYIRLALRYLRRVLGPKLGPKWVEVEPLLEWHTLNTVGKELAGDTRLRSFVFVGANSDVLRVLLTHPQVPHGTTLLIGYRQAESLCETLSKMRGPEALKPYRGRIGLLEQELQRRLAEIPNQVNLERLSDMVHLFKFEETALGDASGEQLFYRFDLEGGRHAYSAGTVYRLEADQDPVFQRTQASSVKRGDLLFEMSDEMRSKLEEALHLNGGGLTSVTHPERVFLKIYHDDLMRRTQHKFGEASRAAKARAIRQEMLALDESAKDCPEGRLEYWLSLSEGDNRPHAPKDAKFFKLFCRTLGISESQTLEYWGFIRSARRLNQFIGRALSAQYAEILFQPESAVTYRQIPAEVVMQLQQEALGCVFRVENIVAPVEARH